MPGCRMLQIGREINLSLSAVIEGVLRFEEGGIILKHISIINAIKVEFSLSAYITLAFKDDRYKSFLKLITEFPEIVECSRVTGKDCLIMKVILIDNVHLISD